jgi:diketogulonate reductase-like aldo/keto reductase
VIGQGTWRLQDERRAVAALVAGIAAGATHVDTAQLYEQRSHSETILGRLFQEPGLRDRVFLASKVLPRNATYEGTKRACEASLRALGTTWLDLYYLHWRESLPLEPTFRAMAELRDAGTIRHIGVSNFDVDDLDEAHSLLGRGVLAANQVLYHLDDRGAESEVIPWCKAHQVAVVAYSPFGAGPPRPFVAEKRRLGVLEDVARGLGRTPRQVALAFLTRDPAVFAIPKTESEEHARENAAASFPLAREAVQRLDEAFPVQRGLRTI